MNRYTICSNLVEYASIKENQDDYFNVLMEFTKDNHLKICVDNKNKAIQLYSSLGVKSEIIRLWISRILFKKRSFFEVVEINEIDGEDSKELFIEIAKNVFGQDKKLLVKSKQDYSQLENNIIENNILIIDKEDFIQRMKNPIISNNFTTTGNNSPLITGTSNTTCINDK